MGRRDFLKLFAAAGGAAAAYPLLVRSSQALAQQPAAVNVLAEDLRLDARALATGNLNGLVAGNGGVGLASGRGRGKYISPVLTARNPFTHAGLHWLATGDLSFEVRWSVDGTAWSEWEPVVIEAHVPEGTRETFAALVGAERGTRLQFRAEFLSGRAQALLQEATVTLLNSTDGPTVTALPAPPATEPSLGVEVYSREEWGAVEAYRFDAAMNEIWDRMYVPVKKIVVHHTATTNNYKTLDAAKSEVRAIYYYHAVTLGWGDIGYNAIIDKWGNVYEGRYGRDDLGREVISPCVVAGHALYHNYGSTGIALLGTFTKRGEGAKPGVNPSIGGPMMTTLRKLLVFECNRHDVGPEAMSDFLRIDSAWNNGLKNIPGHRDCVSTICPGGYVYDKLLTLRALVGDDLALLGRENQSATITPPSSSGSVVREWPASSAMSLQFAWDSNVSPDSFSYLFEVWRRGPVTTDDPYAENVIYKAGFDSNGDGASDNEPYPDWDPTSTTSASFQTLFDAFKATGLTPAAGDRCTLHVVAIGSGGALSYQAEHTLLLT